MTTSALKGVCTPRHRHDLSSVVLGREPSSDESSAPSPRLDDQHADAQPGHQSIPLREVSWLWRCLNRQFRNHRASPLGDLEEERIMFGRIDIAETRAKDRHRGSAGPQTSSVRRRINPAGTAGTHHPSGLRKNSGKACGQILADRGTSPSPDHRHPRSVDQRPGISQNSDPQRRISHPPPSSGVVLVAVHQKDTTKATESTSLPADVSPIHTRPGRPNPFRRPIKSGTDCLVSRFDGDGDRAKSTSQTLGTTRPHARHRLNQSRRFDFLLVTFIRRHEPNPIDRPSM